MKYVIGYLIIPVIKFGWALVLCSIATFCYLIVCTLLLIWNLKLKVQWLEVYIKPCNNISPYWKWRKPITWAYFESEVPFKSAYHYIFGIE